MSLTGSSPAACACIACARPISRPSAVTKLLSAMFWLLKGATEYPSWTRTRARPATSRLLPTLDMVPWIINGLAVIAAPFFHSQAGRAINGVKKGVRLRPPANARAHP